MVRHECDFCHRLKAPDETWILRVCRREHRRDCRPAGDRNRIRVGSEARKLFGTEPPRVEVVEKRVVVPEKRVVRVFPGAKVETRITRTSASPKSKKKRKKST